MTLTVKQKAWDATKKRDRDQATHHRATPTGPHATRPLAPLMGPRQTIGRMIAGERVTKQDQLTDQSEMILVYIDRDVQVPPLDAIGYLAQCQTCPQRAVLHLQPAADWTCPRCTEPAEPEPHIRTSAGRIPASELFPQHQRRNGFGDVDVDQAEPHDWPVEQVSW